MLGQAPSSPFQLAAERSRKVGEQRVDLLPVLTPLRHTDLHLHHQEVRQRTLPRPERLKCDDQSIDLRVEGRNVMDEYVGERMIARLAVHNFDIVPRAE